MRTGKDRGPAVCYAARMRFGSLLFRARFLALAFPLFGLCSSSIQACGGSVESNGASPGVGVPTPPSGMGGGSEPCDDGSPYGYGYGGGYGYGYGGEDGYGGYGIPPCH